MSYWEMDDGFLGHHKTRRAIRSGAEALLMWCALRTYCALHLTDGFVPDEEIDDLPEAPKNPRRWLTILVECGRPLQGGGRGAGLVDSVPGGWMMHDFLEHATPSEEIIERRKAAAERKRNWRNRAKTQDVTRDKTRDGHVTGASGDAGLTPPNTNTSPIPIPLDLEIQTRAHEASSNEIQPQSSEPESCQRPRYQTQPQPSALPPPAPDQGQPATHAAPPVPETRPGAKSARRRDPMAIAMAERHELTDRLFEAYRDEAGLPGAQLDSAREQLFRRLALDGVTEQQVREAVRGAKLDPWARDEAKLSAAAILGKADQREKYIAIYRNPPRRKGARAPLQPNSIGGFGDQLLSTLEQDARVP